MLHRRACNLQHFLLPRSLAADPHAWAFFLLLPTHPIPKWRSPLTPACHRSPAPRRRCHPCTHPSHRCGPPSPSSGRAAVSGSGATSCYGTCPAPSPPRGPGPTRRKYLACGFGTAQLSRGHLQCLQSPLHLVHFANAVPSITAHTCPECCGWMPCTRPRTVTCS